MFVFPSSLHVENPMPKGMVSGGEMSGRESGHEGSEKRHKGLG